MLKKNFKLALFLIFWGVVFGLSFASPVNGYSNVFNIQVEPPLSTAGAPIRFKGSPVVSIDSFKFSVWGNLETEQSSFGVQFFSEDIAVSGNNQLDYTYSGLIDDGPYFGGLGNEELLTGLIEEGQPLPINKDQENNTFFVVIRAFYQNKQVAVNNLTSFTIYRLPYHPVLFIHGLGGRPDSWQSGDRNYFQFLEDNGYASNRLLSYSYAGRHRDTNGYNYDGAVEDIAADMEQAIATLSAQSIDNKVDIVAYSLGNLVARYYLATHKNNHKVRKVVAIAGPHKGSYWMDIDKSMKESRKGAYIEKKLVNLFNSILRQKGAINGELNPESPAAQQIISDSSFLTWLNIAINTPQDVKFYPLYGDIHVIYKRKLFMWEIKKEDDVGDFVILPESASQIAGAVNPEKTAYKETGELKSKMVMNADGSWRTDWLGLDSFKYRHDKLIGQPELKDKVKQILMSD